MGIAKPRNPHVYKLVRAVGVARWVTKRWKPRKSKHQQVRVWTSWSNRGILLTTLEQSVAGVQSATIAKFIFQYSAKYQDDPTHRRRFCYVKLVIVTIRRITKLLITSSTTAVIGPCALQECITLPVPIFHGRKDPGISMQMHKGGWQIYWRGIHFNQLGN